MIYPRHRSLLQLAATLLLAISFAGSAAHAQFNGPPAGIGEETSDGQVHLTTDPAILFPPSRNNVLGSGDTFTLRIYGELDYTPVLRIDRNGNANVPLLGIFHFAGLSVVQAEEMLAAKFESAGIFRDPQININVTDGPDQYISVLGEGKSGVVPALGNRHLLEVLAASGGLQPTASHVITIDRPGLDKPIVVDLGNDPEKSAAANIPLFAGDVVVTSRVGIVYVLGAFKSTGVVPLSGYHPLTLTELTSLSGGTSFVGKFKDLRIIHTVGNRRTVATFDIKKIINGKAPDPILEPNDIVYLPTSPLKSFFAGGTFATILGLLSLGISIEAIR